MSTLRIWMYDPRIRLAVVLLLTLLVALSCGGDDGDSGGKRRWEGLG